MKRVGYLAARLEKGKGKAEVGTVSQDEKALMHCVRGS